MNTLRGIQIFHLLDTWVAADLKAAQRITHKFLWFISRQRTRTEAISSLSELENYLNSDDAKQLAQVVSDYQSSSSVSEDLLLEGFRV